jgi:eukaryotic-like serine/threonine-protein kinase
VSGPRLRVAPTSPGHVVLVGVIDEHAHLLELLELAAPGGALHLDLEGITFINSLGVRDWIRFVTKAKHQGIALELGRVAEPMVQQFNMIIATRSGVRVTSFFAPFACDPCGREDSMCLDVDPDRAALRELKPPPVACPGCGAKMSFNDFPERYFAFLAD